jgi:cytochrome b561
MNATALAKRPDSSERLAAAIAHAGTIVAWFLAPLIVYLVSRESRAGRGIRRSSRCSGRSSEPA